MPKFTYVENSAFFTRQLGAGVVAAGAGRNDAFARQIEEIPGAAVGVQIGAVVSINNAAAGIVNVTMADILRCISVTIDREGGEAYVDNCTLLDLLPWAIESGAAAVVNLNVAGAPFMTRLQEQDPIAAAATNTYQIGFLIPFWRSSAKSPGEYACAIGDNTQAGANVTVQTVNPGAPALPVGLACTTATIATSVNIDQSLQGLVRGIPWRIFASPQAQQAFTMDPRLYRSVWLNTPTPNDGGGAFAAEYAGQRVGQQTFPQYWGQRAQILHATPGNAITRLLADSGPISGILTPFVTPGIGAGVGRAANQTVRWEFAAPLATPVRAVSEIFVRQLSGSPGVPLHLTKEQIKSRVLAKMGGKESRILWELAGRQAEVPNPRVLDSKTMGTPVTSVLKT